MLVDVPVLVILFQSGTLKQNKNSRKAKPSNSSTAIKNHRYRLYSCYYTSI